MNLGNPINLRSYFSRYFKYKTDLTVKIAESLPFLINDIDDLIFRTTWEIAYKTQFKKLNLNELGQTN